MPRLGLIILLATTALFGPVQAAVNPAPSANDPRIRVVEYAPDQVVTLNATLGYAVTLMFGDAERIENVSIGDSLGWQVTPNRRANLLFLKPTELAPATNMTIVTNFRAYTVDLRVRRKQGSNDKAVIFAIRFDYPEPALAVLEPQQPPPPPEPPKDVNHAYSYLGSDTGLPLAVFDDGRATYFRFADTTDYPAIFAIDPDKKEASVNIVQRDGLVVVDRLAAGFVLRRGAQVTKIVNDAFHPDQGQVTTLTRHKGR